MGRLGRDPAFFRYVRPGDITGEIRARARRAMVELPMEDNPWLRHALTGSFGPSLPPYARPEAFEAIRANLGALEFFRGSTADAARAFGRGAFDAFNLSDILEYMDEAGFRVVNNCGDAAGQSVKHLHFHLMAGREFTWPAG